MTNESAKYEILNLSVFFLALACKTISIKTHSTESRFVTAPENILFGGVRVFFSPEMLQAGAVKGLITFSVRTYSLLTHAAVTALTSLLLCVYRVHLLEKKKIRIRFLVSHIQYIGYISI